MSRDWLPIVGHASYEVSSQGDIRNARTGRLLTLQRSDSGYDRVHVTDGGRRRSVLVHLAVLRAFVGPAPSSRHDGAHLDGDQRNNRLDNLEWKLPEDNEADKRAVGTVPRRFSGHRKTSHVIEVYRLLADGASYTRIARTLGLHRSSVSRIARGQRHRRGLAKCGLVRVVEVSEMG